MTFTAEQFTPYKTFLEDVCYLVEYAKLHWNDFNNTALIYHLESYVNVASSIYKDAFLKVLNNALGAVRIFCVKSFSSKTESQRLLVVTEPISWSPCLHRLRQAACQR